MPSHLGFWRVLHRLVEALLREAAKRGTRQSLPLKEITAIVGVSIKSSKSAVSLAVKKSGAHAAFAVWLDENLEDIIQRSYAEFTEMNLRDEN